MVFFMCFLSLILSYLTTVRAVVANSTTYPYTVAIFQPGLAGYSATTFICSGVLIAPTKVLTLVECITGLSPDEITLRAGTSDSTFQNISASSITPHPNYDMDTLSNDVAIIHLASPVTNGIPAVLGSGPGCENVTLVSWGPTTNDTQSISPSPKRAVVGIIPADVCAKTLSTCYTLDPKQHFCTRVTGEGQAYGDGGGPVIDSETGHLVGLISGNPVCAGPNRIALQVDLSDFSDFINNNATG
ncbi:trypsin-like cysteine/serine peptidase domain-containing protein [Delphinella strobiligena]|nr:trypsin-like cysteine/serine peptidase domain-containing protein [Delphinella strobiligena]